MALDNRAPNEQDEQDDPDEYERIIGPWAGRCVGCDQRLPNRSVSPTLMMSHGKQLGERNCGH